MCLYIAVYVGCNWQGKDNILDQTLSPHVLLGLKYVLKRLCTEALHRSDVLLRSAARKLPTKKSSGFSMVFMHLHGLFDRVFTDVPRHP